MLLQVETIPDEFKNCVDYRAAFHNPVLEEIRYLMDKRIETSSRCIYVQCYEQKASTSPDNYTLSLTGGNVIPSRGDIMLLSKRGLKYREQIINDGSYCTILVVWSTTKKHDTILADVKLSRLPFGGNLNEQQNSYQVLHLENLTTFHNSWKAMTGVCNRRPQIFDLILTKNNDCVCPTFVSLNLSCVLHFFNCALIYAAG